MHWIDRIAKALLRRGKQHVIASGISISGHIHIGHSNDIFIADGIRSAVEDQDGKAKAIWYSDDFDPMRRVPWPLPKKYKKYLGIPYINIPSPDPEYENFADFFVKPFLDSIPDFGIRLESYSSAEVYRSGRMSKLIRTALERADEIREILNRYRSIPLPEDWLPYDAACENCGRIATTRAKGWQGDHVSYVCEGCDYVGGCGYEGEANYTKGEGKLTWRVEWPARWRLLGVTCEPFGKDHAVFGGSYDTGKLISKRVFGREAPYPVPYEWISLMGKPMSSSEGIVFTLPQWLEIAEPELLRYFIFRSKAMKAKDFDPRLPLLDLYDEYDRLEKIYFRRARIAKRRRVQLNRIYELSQTKKIPKRGIQKVPFRFAAALSQVARNRKRVKDISVSRRLVIDPGKSDMDSAMQRLALAREWLKRYAPEHLRFKLMAKLPREIKRSLGAEQREGLLRLAEDLGARDYGPVELHNRVYEVAREIGLKPPELFKAIYLVLLGRDSGPRVGNFISVLDKEFVIDRFKSIKAE